MDPDGLVGVNPSHPIIQVSDKNQRMKEGGEEQRKGGIIQKIKENQLELLFSLVLCDVSFWPPIWSSIDTGRPLDGKLSGA